MLQLMFQSDDTNFSKIYFMQFSQDIKPAVLFFCKPSFDHVSENGILLNLTQMFLNLVVFHLIDIKMHLIPSLTQSYFPFILHLNKDYVNS